MASVNLKSRIEGLRRQNAHNQQYIPDSTLRSLLTESVVYAELEKVGLEQYLLEEVTPKIIEGGQKVFAITVLIEEVRLVKKLMERYQSLDHSLPISLEDLRNNFDSRVAINFDETQWEFLAPQFTQSMISKTVLPKNVLPFLTDKKIGEGGFGCIYEISLDPDHQRLQGKFSEKLVRKELAYDHHLAELETLSILSLLKHPNIISLLGSYKHENRHEIRYNLIFPLAKDGDLASLLSKPRSQTLFQSNETAFCALASLASALEYVHDFVDEKLNLRLTGCHHDLRPKNILVSRNTLLLADFGLSRFKDHNQDSKTVWKTTADCYLAPECEDLEDNFRKGTVGRSSDIWSFGCVLAETLVYMAFGPRGVEDFRTSRQFTNNNCKLACFHRGSEPNPSVEEWLQKLVENESKLVENGSKLNEAMVTLIKRMLSLEEVKRPKAKEVTCTLRLIAISEIAESITVLYNAVRKEKEALDDFLRLNRFEAWKHGLGIRDQTKISTSESESVPSDLEYENIFSALTGMRDALDSSNGQSLAFRDFARFNDCLYNLLTKDQEDRATTFFISTVQESQYFGSIGKSLDELQSPNEPSMLVLDRKVRICARLKAMTELTEMHAAGDNSATLIQSELIRNLRQFENHDVGDTPASTGNQSVLVEWRTYYRQNVDSIVDDELFKRLERVTAVLQAEKPKGFRALPCRGFFHDKFRGGFGVVYDLPLRQSESPESDLSTLKCMIDSRQGISREPLLEDKFALAAALAKALLGFHLVGWLHKDFTSSNILVCRRHSIPEFEPIREPYIIGFNHSRPDEPAAFTEGPSDSGNDDYQHPAYRRDRRGYQQQYDYYSLGIILLEIGLWNTLGKWKEKWEGSPRNTLSAEKLEAKLKSRASVLGQAMGSSYKNAVMACLEEDLGLTQLPEDEREKKKTLQLEFQRLVVDRLGKPLGQRHVSTSSESGR